MDWIGIIADVAQIACCVAIIVYIVRGGRNGGKEG